MLGAVLAACSERSPQPPAPAPQKVDTSRIADDALVAAVLDECHKPLRGGMDRVAAGVTLPDGKKARLFAQLPDALRAIDDEGQFLVTGGAVLRLDGPPATEPQQARMRALLALLDAAAFGPLHRANGCRRLGANEYELTQPNGPPFRLRLRADTLLPQSLAGAAGEVTFGDYLRTPTTWMAKSVSTAALGACEIVFEKWDQEWAADFFTPPGAGTQGTERPRIPYVAGGSREPQSETPTKTDARAADWVLLDDPGTWPERTAVYAPVHKELEQQDQIVAGFPIFFRDGARKVLAVQFRPRDDKVRFVPPPGWRIENRKAGSLLFVYPPKGDVAAGEAMLREALASQGLVADGPICEQPWLHLEDGVPSAEQVAKATVRMFVPIR